MHATHLLKSSKVIAVDLDGTLAQYSTFKGIDVIGSPIKPMVQKVKAELKKGSDIQILTARAHPWKGKAQQAKAIKAVEAWSKKHLGKKLKVTCEKHPLMEELWDDRAKEVIKNTGRFKH